MKLSLNTNIPNINPKVLADILFRKDKRVDMFVELEPSRRVELIRSVTPRVRSDLMQRAPDEVVAEVLGAFDPDEATDILQQLTPKKREKVLGLVSEELKGSLSTLLEFDPDTAAGLMTLDYVVVSLDDNIEDVAKKFRTHEKRTGRPPVIIVMDEDKLAGFLPGHELGFAAKSERIDKYIKRMLTISYAADHDKVVKLFRAHPHNKVAVLNDSGDVVGIIYSDDVLRIIEQETASSLYDYAGIHQSETVADSARQKVKNRYKWLIVNLGTSFLAAGAVGLFEDTLEKYVLLAVYMPIVAGMGGNAATQTLAVQVRGIALGQITLRTAWRTLKNELGAGLVNGLINAVIVMLVVILFTGDYGVALVLALAMVVNLVVAALFGTLVPLIMAKLGKDPATSATIFITTGTDVLGFLAFLGLATVLLN
jgi:magnesium transporter